MARGRQAGDGSLKEGRGPDGATDPGHCQRHWLSAARAEGCATRLSPAPPVVFISFSLRRWRRRPAAGPR